MTRVQLIWRSAVYHRRANLAVATGVAVAAAVLTGALLMGDSVRYSLRRLALRRLGNVAYAVDSGHRFFSDAYVSRLDDATAGPVAGVLRTRAFVEWVDGPGGRTGVGAVTVLGVDDRFAAVCGIPKLMLEPGRCVVGHDLARALGGAADMGPGSELRLVLERAPDLSRDAMLSDRSAAETVAIRGRVEAIAGLDEMSSFRLHIDMRPTRNLFVSRSWLQSLLSREGQVNMLLAPGVAHGGVAAPELEQTMARTWVPGDGGYVVKDVPELSLQVLSSADVFMPDSLLARLQAAAPQAVAATAYMVNALRVPDTDRSLPYSFVLACPDGLGLPFMPAGLPDDGVMVNAWTAARLGLKVGDLLDISYYVMLPDGSLPERNASFKVHGIVPMAEAVKARALIPRFPGLTNVDRCRDWQIGMPLDPARLRDEGNEAYWREYRETPRLFLSRSAARAMWSNPYGTVTGILLPRSGEPISQAELARVVTPQQAGLVLDPVRETALRSVEQAMDFGQLFAGMSFFVLVSALLLAGLLMVLAAESRRNELSTLSALGYRDALIRRLLFVEYAFVSLVGVLVGLVFAGLYTRGLILGCRLAWSDALAGLSVVYHAQPWTLVTGAVLTWLFSLLGCRTGARVVLAGRPGMPRSGGRRLLAAGMLLIVVAVVVVLYGYSKTDSAPTGFFIAGSALLAGLLLCIAGLLRRPAATGAQRSLTRLLARNQTDHPGRALGVVALTAVGVFLVVAVSGMNEDLAAHAGERSSGTGGFGAVVETSVPVGRDRMPGAGMVPIRVLPGDDAGCLNLGRAARPRLYGVGTGRLATLGAFAATRADAERLWAQLDAASDADVVPALAGDHDTWMWGLERRDGVVPDRVYTDDSGRPFRVHVVGSLPMRLSVFHGGLLIAESQWVARYPSRNGYHLFLSGADPARTVSLFASSTGHSGRQQSGVSVMAPLERLESFYAVERAYLSAFLVLGALGLLLGTVGVGVVLLRNLQDRRAQQALLQAVGFPSRTIARCAVIEHSALLALGVVVGGCAALPALVPSWRSATMHVPVFALGGMCLLIVVLGGGWTALLATLSSRVRVLEHLADE